MSNHNASLLRRLQHTPLRDAIRGRITARLDLEQLYSQSQAPPATIQCVRRVVCKARLWRSERVEVATELLAHFVDGQDAGASTDELLERFGNEKRAAKLIRRAKRRQRPRVWHAWRATMWCTAALMVWYVGLWAYYWSGTPTPSVDYLAQINARAAAVPEDQRAWPVYEKAWEELKEFRDESFWGEMPREIIMGEALLPGHESWPKMERWLLEHQDAIAKVREASKLPGLGTPLRTQAQIDAATNPPTESVRHALVDSLVYTHLPPLGTLRGQARILSHDALRAAANGNGQVVTQNLIATLGIARQCDEHPILIEALIGVSIQASALSNVAVILEIYPEVLSDTQWRDIAHTTTQFDVMDVMKNAYRGELTCSLDVIQRFYTDDGNGDGRITVTSLRDARSMILDFASSGTGPPSDDFIQKAKDWTVAARTPWDILRTASRREMVNATYQLYQLYEVQLSIPMWEQPESEIDRPAFFREDGRHGQLTAPYWLLDAFTPAVGAARRNAWRLNAKQSALLTAIALELYRRDHNAWPTSLDELTPAYLPAVPLDPMTGEPLKYRIHQDQPLIYSVGADRDDDGGRAPLDRDGEPNPRGAAAFQVHPSTDVKTEKSIEGDWLLWPVFDIPLIEKTDD